MLAAALCPAERRPAFLDEVMDGVWATCEETRWAWSAHDVRVRGTTPGRHGLLPDPGRHTLDLGASGAAVLLALTDAMVGDELDRIDPMVRRRLRDEVSQRVLRPYMERSEWGWYDGSTAKLNNWNPWIHSELLLATALTVQDPERRTALVSRIVQGLEHYVAAQPRDGGCDEGPHYWWRAGASLFECLETITSMLGTNAGVFEHPLIRAMARYPVTTWIGDGWAVNFADGPARPREGAPALLFRYGRRTGQSEASAHARALRSGPDLTHPDSGELFDLRRPWTPCSTPNGRPHRPLPSRSPRTPGCPTPRSWPPGPGRVRRRACSWPRRRANDESHNHNDVGTFIVALDGRPLLIDAGVGTYRKETFGPERYDIWSMTSEYHNVPIVNGFGQPPGRRFRATGVRAGHTAHMAGLTCELACAYPPQARLRSWLRTVRLVRAADERVEIEDVWDCAAAAGSPALHVLVGGGLRLLQSGGAIVTPPNGRALTLSWDASTFAAEAETVALPGQRLSRVWGDAVHRLALTARHPASTGRHTFVARPD